MILNRQWMMLCLAGLCWTSVVLAQTAGGAAGAGGGGSADAGAAGGSASQGGDSSGTKAGGKSGDSTSGTSPEKPPSDGTTPGGAAAPKSGGSVDPFIPTTPKADKPGGTTAPGASSTFGTPPANRDATGANGVKPGGPEAAPGGPSGPSSAFGPSDSTATQQAAPPSFTLPGYFGSPSTTYTGGQGRLARPRFRYKVTTSQGFDDNVLQTPDNPVAIPDQQVLVDPGTQATVSFVPVTTTTYERAFAGEIVYYRPVRTTTIQRVVTPGRAPVIQTIKAPDPQGRTGSAVSRLGVNLDAQQATQRSLFTMEVNGSIDRTWNRPGTRGTDDYSGSLSLGYLYNLTARLTASLTANIAYISQPDFTRINTPDRLGAGDLVNALARLNVSYRITPRISTTLSVGQNAIIYTKKQSGTSGGAGSNGDSFETTVSAEARYLWKPRVTLLAEFRHVLINYPDAPAVDATTELLLVGGEWKFSSRLSGSVRLGESVRLFSESGDSSTAPYGEASVTYRIGPTSNVQWNSRFGYEEPNSPTSEVLSYRTTVTYLKSFTPRLSLSAGITGVSRNTTSPGVADVAEQTVDANIGLEYHMTRQLTLNASFSYTKIITTSGVQDYDRSRIFIGGEYEF